MADMDLTVGVQSAGVPSALEQLRAIQKEGKATGESLVQLAATSRQAMANISTAFRNPALASGPRDFATAVTTTGAKAVSLTQQLNQLEVAYERVAIEAGAASTAQQRLTLAGGTGGLAAGIAAGTQVQNLQQSLSPNIVRDMNLVLAEQNRLLEARGSIISSQGSLNQAIWERETSKLNEVGQAQARLTQAEENYAKSLSEVSRATGALSGGANDPARIEARSAAIAGQAQAYRAVTQAELALTEATNRANAASDRSFQNQNAFQSSFAYFAIAAAAQRARQGVIDLDTAALSASADMQRSFADVDRTFDRTTGSLGDIYQRLIDLSTATPNAFNDLAQIATLGNQLGVSGNNIESFTKTIAQYTAISGQSAESATTAFGKIGALTGLAADQYGNLSSAIAYVARTSVATEGTIQQTAQEISALASGAGFSADAIVGLSGALSSLSIPPERARGALSLYFGALNNAVASGGPKLQEFATLTGISADNITRLVEQNKGQEVFTAFISGLSQLNTVAKTTALDELGLSTIRVDQTMRALSQNVPLLTSSLDGAATAFKANTETARQFTIIQATLSTRWAEFQHAAQNALAAVGDDLSNGVIGAGLLGLLNLLSQALISFREFAKTPVGGTIFGIVGAFSALAIILFTIVGAFGLVKAAQVVIPWSLTQVGADGAGLAVKNFILGLIGMKASADAAATALARTAAAEAEIAAASGGAVVANTALAASEDAVAVSSAAAAVGAKALRAALVTTGIGALVVILGTLYEAISANDEAMKSATQQAKDFFGGTFPDLSGPLKQDQQTFIQTGVALEQIGVKVKGTTTAADSWVSSLQQATGAQVELNTGTSTATKTIQEQTTAYGDNARAALATALANTKNFQKIFDDTASNRALAAAGFSKNDFTKAILGDPVKGGKEYINTFLSQYKLNVAQATKLINALPSVTPDKGFVDTYNVTYGTQLTLKQVEAIKQLGPAFLLANTAANSTSTALSKQARLAVVTAATQTALNEATTGTADGFQGATSALTDYQDAVQSGLSSFTSFGTILQNVADQVKKTNKNFDSSQETAGQFSKGLADANTSAVNFFNGIQQLASGGSSSFAQQLAALGPDAQSILSSSLKLSPQAQQTLEANARFAAFLASDAFKTALSQDMQNSNAAYAEIFHTTGNLADVQSFIQAQVNGTADAWEKAWDLKHPTATLNVDLGHPSDSQLKLWSDEASGKLTVKAEVVPTFSGSQTIKAAANTFTDTVTGAKITLPATLSGKALSDSLAFWEKNENATPKEIAAHLNTAGFSGDVDTWRSAHGPVTVYANLVPTASSIAKMRGFLDHSGPTNARGGLLDSMGRGREISHYAGGGLLRGPGTGTADKIPMYGSAGEYMNPADSVNFWGSDFFDSLSRKMLPTSFINMLGAAATSGSSGPSHVAYVQVDQHNPVTRDPLKQLREDSENLVAGIWG